MSLLLFYKSNTTLKGVYYSDFFFPWVKMFLSRRGGEVLTVNHLYLGDNLYNACLQVAYYFNKLDILSVI